MANRWSAQEEKKYLIQLEELYVKKNLSIREIAHKLKLSQSAVFVRLKRLGITTNPKKKLYYLNKRRDIKIPQKYSQELAEFFGIMLGDGHVSNFQVVVSLGSKEEEYARYVQKTMKSIFGGKPKIGIRKEDYKKQKYRDVYLGSVDVVSWLKNEGLVSNKVISQVDVPKWITNNRGYMESFIRGFFDTDGSIYKLRFGVQIALTNRSEPILKALQSMLWALEYSPSRISLHRVYLTNKKDIRRFFEEIKPRNPKHKSRFKVFNASVV